MGDLSKEQAKAAKKAAKARAKLLKKMYKAGRVPDSDAPDEGRSADAVKRVEGTASSPGLRGPESGDSQLSPAERSAAAAEQQVELRRRELWVSVISTLIALLTLILSFLSFFTPSGQ